MEPIDVPPIDVPPVQAPAQQPPAQALAHNPDVCPVCRESQFTEAPNCDQELASAPVRVGQGRETVRTVNVPPNYKVLCSSVLCRARFHARCITGIPEVAGPEDALYAIPTGWICFWCAAQSMLPGFSLERNLATVFLRGHNCQATLRFPRPDPTKSVMLLCTPGMENSRRNLIHRQPTSTAAQLVVNNLNVQVPRQPPMNNPNLSRAAPVLFLTNDVLQNENTIAFRVPPGPIENMRYFMLAMLVNALNTVDQMVGDVIVRRSLSLGFSLFARLVEAELMRRVGRFLGMADASLQSAKRAWRRFDANMPIRSTALAPPLVGDYVPMALPWCADNLGEGAIMNYGAPGVAAHETSAIDPDHIDIPMEVSFRDPVTRTNIRIPTRGGSCTHASVFDLRTYIVMNRVEGARYMCPHCGVIIFPANLFVDSQIYGIMLCISRGQLAGTRSDADLAALQPIAPNGIGPFQINLQGIALDETVEGVTIRMDGSWTAKTVVIEAFEIDDDDDVLVGPAQPGPAGDAPEGLQDAEVQDVPEVPVPEAPPTAGMKRVQPPRAAKSHKKIRDD